MVLISNDKEQLKSCSENFSFRPNEVWTATQRRRRTVLHMDVIRINATRKKNNLLCNFAHRSNCLFLSLSLTFLVEVAWFTKSTRLRVGEERIYCLPTAESSVTMKKWKIDLMCCSSAIDDEWKWRSTYHRNALAHSDHLSTRKNCPSWCIWLRFCFLGALFIGPLDQIRSDRRIR